MRYCPECGAYIDDHAKFCTECGTALTSTGGDEPRERGQPDRVDETCRETREIDSNTAEWSGDESDRNESGKVPWADSSDTHHQQDGRETGDATRVTADDTVGLLSFSIAYPGRSGFEPLLIGAVVGLGATFLFWLLIPLFLLAGYFVQVTRAAGRGEPKPPMFDDWGGMLANGAVLTVVLVVYGIAYVIGLAITSEIHPILELTVFLGGIYVAPAVYMNYSVTDDWKAAFDLPTIGNQVTTGTYVYGFLLWLFVVNLIGMFVVGVLLFLSMLTIIGIVILWPLIYVYWIGIDAALWGRVYNRIDAT